MNNDIHDAGTRQARWARLRFSIIGHLLSAPPGSGELKKTLEDLSQKQWRHPITGNPVSFSVSTIERWLYHARKKHDPVDALRSKRRNDAGKTRQLSIALKQMLQQQYREHPRWSYKLHADNLACLVKKTPALAPMPSYNTVRRHMRANNLTKQRRLKNRHTPGAQVAADRLESREVRGFEMDHVHALWHLDFHHGSRKILGHDGKWHKPLLLAIMDDRSRIVCHAQWYLDETTETLVHGFMQALQKRALPRALMSDNGAAMTAAEFTEGLERLSILHQPTLPYSPYQNAKQEVFWAQVEGRLMAMLEGEPEMTLSLLNKATIAWVELEYHRKIHSELGCTPLERYLQGPDVGRLCPDTATLRHAFCMQIKRKQRKSDGTFSLGGKRFEVASHYRHLEVLCIHYARWDLSIVTLVDPHSNARLSTLYPQDKSANASSERRAFTTQSDDDTKVIEITVSTGIAPLLKELMAEYAATGLPPAYLPKGDLS
jgi:transposase InsO family protein